MGVNVNKIVFWILLISLFSCHSINVECMPYLITFQKYFNTTDSISIILEDVPKPAIGYCYHFERMIVLDQTYWKQASSTYREELLYHELGHCLLNLDHEDDKRLDGCPISLMNSSIIPEQCYIDNKDYYLNRMNYMRRDK